MTIRDLQGRLFQPGFIADISTGNLLWVDQINGNDDLAVRGRMTVPFKTLTKAKAAAVSGDTIMVLPGIYNENNLLKNGVNWHFFSGAKVVYNSATAGTIFDASSGSAVTSRITGDGEFSVVAPGTGSHVVHLGIGSCDLHVRGRSLIAAASAVKIGSGTTGGKLVVEADATIWATNEPAIQVAGSAANHRFSADEIYSHMGGVSVTGGGAYIRARTIGASSQPGVHVGGTTSAVAIQAFEIFSTNYIAVRNSGTSTTSILNILNARIKSSGATSTGRAVHVGTTISGNPPNLKLTGCVLIASGDVSIGAANVATRVQLNGGLVANKDKGTLSFLPVGSSFLFDSNIS